jgi:hypothetical protein
VPHAIAAESKNGRAFLAKTETSYYIARISMASDEVARFNGLKSMPGMPVKPMHDQVVKAFRER